MKWNEAIQLLETCERGLRTLVADAAGEGDYAGVLRIADLAKAVSALAEEGRSMSSQEPTPLAGAVPGVPVARVSNSMHAVTRAVLSGGRRSRVVADAYPKFFRRGDELVKVGWSKKERKEYNHRAPRTAVDLAAVSIRHTGAKGKMFNGDALLPVKNPVDDTPLPDYQVYVALAWLKHLGVVEQQGRRGGYVLAADKPIESTIAVAWPELAEWRG